MTWDINDPFRHYYKEENVARMADRLARGEITDEKAEWLARADHRTHGWAGTPEKFDEENGHYRGPGSKARDIARAKAYLEKLKLDKEKEAE